MGARYNGIGISFRALTSLSTTISNWLTSPCIITLTGTFLLAGILLGLEAMSVVLLPLLRLFLILGGLVAGESSKVARPSSSSSSSPFGWSKIDRPGMVAEKKLYLRKEP